MRAILRMGIFSAQINMIEPVPVLYVPMPWGITSLMAEQSHSTPESAIYQRMEFHYVRRLSIDTFEYEFSQLI